MEGLLLVGKTFFILIVLGGGALVFSADANRIVLIPIDRMVQRVKNMADNPRTNTIEKEPQKPLVELMPLEAADTEMRILEASIDKITELLGVAFGDAGVNIVSANMKCIGELNPMVPGHRTVAIFGFCDIRNFTDITEILQEGVMSFVNTIAEIVHCEVHDHAGAANKNIGDAFLLVWKFREGFTDKHLRALLKATQQCVVGRSVEDFEHARHSDVSCCAASGHMHSVARVSSFGAMSTRSSFKHGDGDADNPTLAAAAADAAATLTVDQPGPGRRLDRSQLSLMLHGAWSAPVAATSKGKLSDMHWPEPLSMGGADDAGDLQSVLPLHLPLHDVPAASLCGLWSLPDGEQQADRVVSQADANSAHSHDAGECVISRSDTALEASRSVIVPGELARVSTSGSALQDFVRHGSAASETARSPVSQLAAKARTAQDAASSDGAPAWPSSGPVGEGKEEQARSGGGVPGAAESPSTNSSSVRFRMQPRGLVRHKSSNYTRLLDNYRRLLVHAQCAWTSVSDRLPQTDALKIPQEGREEPVGSISPLIDARLALPEAAAFQPSAARHHKSAEVMCGPPEKLCGHAEHAQMLADNALNSFIIINAALQRSSALAEYTGRDDVQKRMGKGYRVGMGFGLHTGWSIEGAIGSRYKVDASYLSPNVNMAARLESATKQYGVDILMSDDFAALLSPRMRARCRQIDTVLVKGSAQPMAIWTIDTDTRFMVSDSFKVHAGSHAFVHSSRTDFAWVEAGLEEFEGHTDVQLSYAADADFLLVWQTAFDFYKAGDWLKARSHFEQTYTMRRDRQGCVVRDTPSKVLMDFMALTHFVAPGDWNGSRALTEK